MLKKAITANATSIDTELTGDHHGLALLTMTPQMYAIFLPAALIRPLNPGMTPEPSTNGTPDQIAAAQWKFSTQPVQLKIVINAKRSLNNQVIEDVDNTWLNSIQGPVMGFNNVTLLDMLQYLYACSGKDMKEAPNSSATWMDEIYNPNEPINIPL